MKKNVGVLIYENVQPMDVIGPWEIFSFWKNILLASIEMFLISENGSYVQCDNAITLKAHCDFDTAPQMQYLIVPGGRGRLKQVNNNNLINFLKQQAMHSEYILSICTGAFLLYQTGLLDGKEVTSYWRALPELKRLPNIKVREERIIKNDKIWIAGGVTSGIDLALALIAEVAGKETAGKIQLLFEYFPLETIYSSIEMANDLPEYNGKKNSVADLPDYIKRFLRHDG